MAWPWLTAVTNAIARLALYNNGTYNASSNPRGLAQGGHIVNVPLITSDIAVVAPAISEAAQVAASAAENAETFAAEASAAAGRLSGTSATALTIGTGDKDFITQAGKSFEFGRAIRAVSASNPTGAYMVGKSKSYSGTGLTIDVEISVGSGSHSDWILYVEGEHGSAGTFSFGAVTALPPGAMPTAANTGTESAAEVVLGIPVGKPAGLAFTWSTATTNDDPGAGKLKLNSVSLSAAVMIHISETDADGRAVAALIAAWDDSTTLTNRALLKIFDPVTPANFVTYRIVGANVDNGGWDTLTVAHVDHGGTLANGQRVYVEAEVTGDRGVVGQAGEAATITVGPFVTGAPGSNVVIKNAGTPTAAVLTGSIPAGVTGARGAVVAMKYYFSGVTTDSDPGPGNLRFNSSTIGSATQAFIDNTEAGGVDVTAWLDSFDDSTNPVKGFLEYVVETEPTIRGLFSVTGSVVDGTGYRKITIANLFALGAPANGASLGVHFLRAGNKGENGTGTGTVVGPLSSTVNYVPQWDTTDGVMLKNGVALTGANVAFSPTGNLSASTVQAALAELDTEKQAADATLSALAALDGTAGLLEQTGGDTFVRRAIGTGASTSIPTRGDADARYLLQAGGTLTGALTLAGDGSSSLHPVSKQQLDAALLSLGKRNRVRVATTANITIATALNSGDTLDGVTLADGDLVLVKDQTAPEQNGVYVVGASPARFIEFDAYDEHPGTMIGVDEGSIGADTLWVCWSNRGGTLNTTAITFTKLSVQPYTAGGTLTLSGLQFSLNLNSANTWSAAQTFPNAGIKIKDPDASHDLTIVGGSNLTANRSLTLTTGDADRTVSLGGNLTMGGAFTTAGAFAITLTATGTTALTLPASGTLAILGANTFTGTQTLPASTSGAASLNVPHGTAPSSPSNGDLWSTTAGFYARVNGTTVGPFGAGSGGPSEATSTEALYGSGGSTTKFISPDKLAEAERAQYSGVGTSLSWDRSNGKNARFVLNGPATLHNPLGTILSGESGSIQIQQDAPGGRTLSFGSMYDFGSAGTPTISTGANKVDIIRWTKIAFGNLRCTFHKDA